MHTREVLLCIYSMRLNNTPYIIIWYVTLPTLWHFILLYHYKVKGLVSLFAWLFFFQDNCDTLSYTLFCIIRNLPYYALWHLVTRYCRNRNSGGNPCHYRKSYSTWHIVTLFIWLCPKFIVSLGWLWVGV